MAKTRDNHYVPQWYQKGFFADDGNQLRYLCLEPNHYSLPDGRTKVVYPKKWYSPSQCFYQTDLYTIFFGQYINDEIERELFGQIDDTGCQAVRAYIDGDARSMHENFENLFIHLDAQKIRTPKGLDWIHNNYPRLNQLELMTEMQAIRNLHCTLWTEGVREIVTAKESEVKFIVSDHPVTVYNYACPPTSEHCVYPNDPDISLKASQTIYPLDKNHILILTNLEYAEDPDGTDPIEKRTHANKMRQSLVRTDAFIRTRNLNADEITKINHIIKSRAKKYIGSGMDEWLYPEDQVQCDWSELRDTLLPPTDQMFHFGGEIYVGNKDGTTHYQDAFGRTTPQSDHLIKDTDENKIGDNDPCGCGSGKKYKRCCKNVPLELRTTWKLISIRERNLTLYNAIYDVLGLSDGKTWDDVRRDITDEQISKIYGIYGVLWPLDTDIYNLLPKPDRKFRGLYTGLIDPRTIGTFALGMSQYFDQLLILHPFINPNNIKPEFSPVDSPGQYKYQALKSIFFLLGIEPLVRSGLVNLIPDPCDFDYHLQHQILDMAEGRRNKADIGLRDKRISYALSIEDLLNTTYMMPEHVKDDMIREQFRHLTDEQVAKLKLELDAKAKIDPLVLLQEMEPGVGQLMMFQMTPNYELALFIAQATGSVIVTDSETRWTELQGAQHRKQGIASYPWQVLSDSIGDISLTIDPIQIADDYTKAEYSELRSTLRAINNIIRDGVYDAIQIKRLQQQLLDRFARINERDKDYHHNVVKIRALMPEGGFSDNNSQRLLLKSNCQTYMRQTDMVIYLDLK